ncbi:MAG TPA: hypothetical protein VGX37_09270 [Allosphingosinicella sp.]|jgi:hypothetical protein|nr:hypothetical protein [Allosphingosinicella sp.]
MLYRSVRLEGFEVPRDTLSSPYQDKARPQRPRRVLPLALAAVAATVTVAGMASELFRDLSGDRYAEEILRDLF